MESRFMESNSPDNVKMKVEKIESYFKVIEVEVTCNLKLFDVLMMLLAGHQAVE